MRGGLALLLLAGLALAAADEAPAETAPEAPVEAPAEGAAAPAASVMDHVKKIKAPKVVGGGYAHKAEESHYSATASYGAPHFLLMCILLVFIAAGCKEAYDRYGPDAKKHKKKKHNTIGGYGAVDQDDGDEEAPSLMSDLKGLMGGGTGAVSGGVGQVSGGVEKGASIFAAVTKNIAADLQKAGLAAADKAKSGVSDAVDVQAHMEKVKAGAAVMGNVASAAAEDAKKGAEAGISKGLDTARSASDVSAHLEKAKAAAQVATNVASAAASDAAAASKEAASAGLSAADPNKLVALAKDSAAKVGDAASAAADAAQQSARGASSILSARSADDKKEEKVSSSPPSPRPTLAPDSCIALLLCLPWLTLAWKDAE